MTLILGGAASGKSEFAETMAKKFGPRILYLATAMESGKTPVTREWREKIERHRGRRPKTWWTEVLNGGNAGPIGSDFKPQAILLDSLTLWVSARFQKHSLPTLQTDLSDLIHALRSRSPLIIVSDEVGMGLVPPARAGRKFMETLGRINSRLAAEATDVVLVVSGQSLTLKTRG